MQSKQRTDRLNEARKLLSGEPARRPGKCWVTITSDGKTDFPEDFDYQEDIDVWFNVIEIGDNDPKMIAHRKSCGIVE
jgi:hypothetical protein